ncbi:gliding motility-associated C-terminal domain-containing protein [Spirosoma agri]|uniref:T9SS type B sorting domain-containing protein n=1 Tax=Spirosoma agri TaxID=1987381 RepID=A0A6M0IKG4_9BACT|nr:gliding motility-associated C-terminal domain-containing protein [Spirosoma agri]NEU68367.1 T9SS type B sorting domain-containing protein [Spirosoma agri]
MTYVYLFFLGLFSGLAAIAQNCPTLVTPGIKVSPVGLPNGQASASFCQGERVQLNALTGATGVSYQWKRDGADIAGATGSTLTVSQAGAYAVTLTQTGNCSGSIGSGVTTISVNQCGSGGLVPILGGQLEDYNAGAETQSYVFLKAVYLTNTASPTKFPSSIKAYVYQKRDNKLVTTVSMGRGSIQDGQFTPLPGACDGDESKIQNVLYFGSINFLASVYNDPDGYYVTTEPVCCREVSDNVAGTGPVVFYMELGDRTRYNLTSSRSTFGSVFGLPARIETCVNQPVQLNSYVTASTNLNNVRYSLVTPSTGDASTPVKDVSWATGYGANRFMESAAPLQIDQSGIITGTPTKVGTFRYGVKAELFQGTFKGFELRRELMLQVKECPAATPPTVVLSAVGKPSEPVTGTICENGSVQLTAKTPLKNVNYQWYLNDKPVNGATDSVLVSRQGGRYTVVVTSELSCPKSASASPVSVTVSPSPTVNLIVGSLSGSLCQGGALTLTAASSAVGATFRWQRDTTTITGATSAVYETNRAGSYVVTVTDGNGCTGRSTPVPVTTNAPPDASILTAENTICSGGRLRLQANTGSNLSYQWIRNGSPVSGAVSVAYDASEAGVYTVIVKAASSCTAISAPKSVSVTSPPTVTITGPVQLCRNATVPLAANASGTSLTYIWLLNGVTIPGATGVNVDAKSGGNYQVKVTDPNQCSATSANWLLTEIDKVNVLIDSIPPFCGTASTPVTLAGTPAGGVFSGNGIVGSQFSPALAGVGAHDVVYTVTGATTCQSGTTNRMIVVRAGPTVNLPDELVIQPGGSVTLPGPASPTYQYSWSPSAGLNMSSVASPMASPDQTTLYRLVVQDSFGCTAQDSVRVVVVTQLYVPDAFTPNGDGQNDVWALRNLTQFKDVEVTILNRWGLVVFQSTGYDRPFDGQGLPMGVYGYVITYDTPKKRLVGSVVLLR